jgi:hypothetical protein
MTYGSGQPIGLLSDKMGHMKSSTTPAPVAKSSRPCNILLGHVTAGRMPTTAEAAAALSVYENVMDLSLAPNALLKPHV